jgi:hypothetical protein
MEGRTLTETNETISNDACNASEHDKCIIPAPEAVSNSYPQAQGHSKNRTRLQVRLAFTSIHISQEPTYQKRDCHTNNRLRPIYVG